MSKGQFPEDIGWTLIVLVVVVFIGVAFIIYGIVLTRVPVFGKDPIGASLEFVQISNKPHLIAESLLFRKIADRQFIEHAIESSFVGSVWDSGSQDIHDEIRYFFKQYKDSFRFYQVTIKDTDGKEIFLVSNKLTGCMDDKNNVGVCTKKFKPEACGKGADEIKDVYGSCKSGEVCCVEYEYKTNGHIYFQSRVYPDDPNKRETPCGPNQNEKTGICDYPRKVREFIPDPTSIFKVRLVTLEICREGRLGINEEGDECRKLRCCSSLLYGTSRTSVDTKSVVPLLYKGRDKVGYVEVIVGV